MAKLWEIADAIEKTILDHTDPETGEIGEGASAALDRLVMDRDAKALAVARYLMGEKAEGDAVKAQVDRLARRARVHHNRADRLLRYLQAYLPEGHKLQDDVVQIRWSWPEVVEVDESVDLAKWPEELVKTTREPRKTVLKRAAKEGEPLPKGVVLRKRPKLGVR